MKAIFPVLLLAVFAGMVAAIVCGSVALFFAVWIVGSIVAGLVEVAVTYWRTGRAT